VVHASPIGDVTSMLLAMGAVVEIADAEAAARGRAPAKRRVPLERFFLGYKKLDLLPGEVVSAFLVPRRASLFSFEKVSRRERLDIASVNSALALELAEGGSIARARISLGGVAPIPTLAEAAGAGLVGKRPDAAAAIEAAAMAVEIATPIGDVRGSAAYRLRLTDRLVRAHFARLFPTLEEELFR
jgi:xanthine dehydrogenase small subunit